MWRAPKNTEEEDEMAAKRSELAKISTADLVKTYKADCAEFKRIVERSRVYREELVARQNVADAEAKLAAAKAEHAAGTGKEQP